MRRIGVLGYDGGHYGAFFVLDWCIFFFVASRARVHIVDCLTSHAFRLGLDIPALQF